MEASTERKVELDMERKVEQSVVAEMNVKDLEHTVTTTTVSKSSLMTSTSTVDSPPRHVPATQQPAFITTRTPSHGTKS